jgi:hypothetical protein
MSEEEINLITFNSISKFVRELCGLYGKKHRSLALYSRLITKTTIAHEKPILKHVQAFKKFCVNNRDCIISKNEKNMKETMITYSPNVFIDMNEIFRLINEETSSDQKQIKNSVWKHFLTISALVDPAGKAKEILRETAKKQTGESSGNEVEFISNIIDKVEKNVDPNANPMEAIGSIMQSGVVTDLIQNMNQGLTDGNLDLGKLMGAVTGMVSSLGSQDGGGGEGEGGDDAMKMLNNMMGSFMGGMKQPSESDGVNPETPNMQTMMSTFMSGMQPPSDTGTSNTQKNINDLLSGGGMDGKRKTSPEIQICDNVSVGSTSNDVEYIPMKSTNVLDKLD